MLPITVRIDINYPMAIRGELFLHLYQADDCLCCNFRKDKFAHKVFNLDLKRSALQILIYRSVEQRPQIALGDQEVEVALVF